MKLVTVFIFILSVSLCHCQENTEFIQFNLGYGLSSYDYSKSENFFLEKMGFKDRLSSRPSFWSGNISYGLDFNRTFEVNIGFDFTGQILGQKKSDSVTLDFSDMSLSPFLMLHYYFTDDLSAFTIFNYGVANSKGITVKKSQYPNSVNLDWSLNIDPKEYTISQPYSSFSAGLGFEYSFLDIHGNEIDEFHGGERNNASFVVGLQGLYRYSWHNEAWTALGYSFDNSPRYSTNNFMFMIYIGMRIFNTKY